MELDGYDDAQIIIPDMVTISCQLNQVMALVQVLIQRCLIEQVFKLMLEALNLKVILLKLFMQNVVKLTAPFKPMHTPWCLIILVYDG